MCVAEEVLPFYFLLLFSLGHKSSFPSTGTHKTLLILVSFSSFFFFHFFSFGFLFLCFLVVRLLFLLSLTIRAFFWYWVFEIRYLPFSFHGCFLFSFVPSTLFPRGNWFFFFFLKKKSLFAKEFPPLSFHKGFFSPSVSPRSRSLTPFVSLQRVPFPLVFSQGILLFIFFLFPFLFHSFPLVFFFFFFFLIKRDLSPSLFSSFLFSFSPFFPQRGIKKGETTLVKRRCK